MKLSLRVRMFLTLTSLFAVFAILGGIGVFLLYRLGGQLDVILRENYDSVVYMERLNEALERIDSSFQFALAGREDKARQDYEPNWKLFRDNLTKEQDNVTLPGEQELVDKLDELTARYRQQGDAFNARSPGAEERHMDYFDPGGLLDTFKQIKQVSEEILRLNHENMSQASRDARQTPRETRNAFIVGLVATAILGGFLAWQTIRSILRPIQDVTRSAQAIGAGNLDQVVPVLSRDELGDLAHAFNGMARQLRHYRQSDYSKLTRAQQTSQATIDSFPDPVFVVNIEGQVEMANPAARQLLGLGGIPSFTAPLTWNPPEVLKTALADALTKQIPYLPESFDRAVPLSDAGERSFLPRLLPIRDPYGNTLGAAVLLLDVTRFRLLDQVKSNLVATVSHELKTPLTGIRLAMHVLLEESIGPLTPKQTELLLNAREDAERLLATVNNLLDLARLEQGRQPLDLRPEQPAQLLSDVADAARPRAEDKGVSISVEAAPDLPAVAVDVQRLGYALSNLLDNAINFTERGGRISLAAETIGSKVTLTVADTGRGIAPEHVPHMFERFYRMPGRSDGTGLGLAIVHEIVTAHGGTIACESRLNEGTIFRISLPVAT